MAAGALVRTQFAMLWHAHALLFYEKIDIYDRQENLGRRELMWLPSRFACAGQEQEQAAERGRGQSVHAVRRRAAAVPGLRARPGGGFRLPPPPRHAL